MEDVVYLFRPNREAGFLQDLLKDFKGVLVTDFFTGYDSLPCKHQKCLIHLIRDINEDLKRNPYDEEFKTLAAEFARLLRSIIATIDKYGLKKQRLQKHKVEVARFSMTWQTASYSSELAEGYQQRLVKNGGKLFTFLDHDGVPWNNNNAEHAIRAFADYRKISDGKMREQGLSDYLVLLSIYETCKYRGVSFLKFLLSEEKDVEAYCRSGRRKNGLPDWRSTRSASSDRTIKRATQAPRMRPSEWPASSASTAASLGPSAIRPRYVVQSGHRRVYCPCRIDRGQVRDRLVAGSRWV